jgi:short-subunit dehydrogenase
MKTFLENYWTGKSVVITGASSGIGWALVEALAPFQVTFGLISRRVQPMQELAETFKDSKSRFWIKSCDVKKQDEIKEAIHEFYQYTGSLDVIWVNSGVSGRTSFAKWNWDNFENVLNTNLKGAIHSIIPALEIMAEQNSGTIVGIGSASSMRGMPKHPIYSMTKIGLHYFMESMSAELPQIQFTIIHPGFVDTPLNAGRPGRIWLMQPDKAAQLMIKAVARRKKIYIYPFRMKLVYYLVRFIPAWLYIWGAKRAISSGRAID